MYQFAHVRCRTVVECFLQVGTHVLTILETLIFLCRLSNTTFEPSSSVATSRHSLKSAAGDSNMGDWQQLRSEPTLMMLLFSLPTLPLGKIQTVFHDPNC